MRDLKHLVLEQGIDMQALLDAGGGLQGQEQEDLRGTSEQKGSRKRSKVGKSRPSFLPDEDKWIRRPSSSKLQAQEEEQIIFMNICKQEDEELCIM